MLETYSDDGLATGFGDAGTDEEALFAELWVLHPQRVGFEIISLFADLFGVAGLSSGVLGCDFAQPLHEKFSPAVIEQVFHGYHPAFLRRRVMGIKQCGYIPQVLPGVIEIDDLHGSREVPIGEIPDPDSSVANDDFGCGPLPASAPSLGIYAVSELVGPFDGAYMDGAYARAAARAEAAMTERE